MDRCPKCGSEDTTKIEERHMYFPNAFRPKGIFCNGCGRQTPDIVELGHSVGTWLVREKNGRDKDGAIMELKQFLADLKKIYRGERIHSFDWETQQKMYFELHGYQSSIMRDNK